MEQRIILRTLTRTGNELLEVMQQSLLQIFHHPVVVKVPQAVKIDQAFAPKRNQYLAPLLLSSLRDMNMEPGEKCLDIVEVDLYSPGVKYVFGHADVSLGAAVVSLFRLKQENYGLPRNDRLLEQRVIKEAIHELGHAYYLSHCSDFRCVMHSSRSLADTDKKETVLCPRCQKRLAEMEA